MLAQGAVSAGMPCLKMLPGDGAVGGANVLARPRGVVAFSRNAGDEYGGEVAIEPSVDEAAK